MDETTARIPLRNLKHEIVAYTLIDAADEDLVNGYGRWHRDSDGYAAYSDHSQDARRVLRLHRVLLGLQIGDPLQGDHINRNRLDNRRANLRTVTRRHNAQNLQSRVGTSQFRGVCWHKASGKWIAQCKVGGRCYYFGIYTDEAEAGRAAQEGRLSLLPGAVD